MDMEIDDREEKLKTIHSAIDKLIEEKFGRKAPISQDEEDTQQEGDSGTLGGAILGVDISKLQPMEEEELVSVSGEKELPFLIFENVNGVEELIISPSFSATSLKRIEEIPVPQTENIETKMFIQDDFKGIPELRGEEKALEKGGTESILPPWSTKVEEIKHPLQEKAEEIKTSDDQEIVDEKRGFGWKGLGSRLIIFDKRTKEYRYIVKEPQLTEEEKNLRRK